MIHPDHAHGEEADDVDSEAGPRLAELVHKASVAGRLDVPVESEQGNCHDHDAVAERLGTTLLHAAILPDQINRAPGMTCFRSTAKLPHSFADEWADQMK
jgi:hypothetical protein